MDICVKTINEISQALTESLKPKQVIPKMKRRSSEQKPARKSRYIKAASPLHASPLPAAKVEAIPELPVIVSPDEKETVMEAKTEEVQIEAMDVTVHVEAKEVFAEKTAEEKQELDFEPAKIFATMMAEKSILSVTVPENDQPDILLQSDEQEATDFFAEATIAIVNPEPEEKIQTRNQALDDYFDMIMTKVKPSSPIPPGFDSIIKQGFYGMLSGEQIDFKMNTYKDPLKIPPIENRKKGDTVNIGNCIGGLFFTPRSITKRLKTKLSVTAPAFYPARKIS
jgi:hypothetical protein